MSADLVHRLGATLWALVLLAGWGASVRARRATRARWRGLHGAVPAGGPSPVRAWAVGRLAAPVWGSPESPSGGWSAAGPWR